MRGAAHALALVLAGLPGALCAQTDANRLDPGIVQSAILVIDLDRVFAESAFGQRAAAEIEAEGTAIAAENRRIEAELTEEERDLTERRPTMQPEEFRALADAFDDKVQQLRQAQDGKARALAQKGDEARRRFLTLARPVLENLMREAGAVMIVERRLVFLSASSVDVTETAILRIDAAIGDGGTP